MDEQLNEEIKPEKAEKSEEGENLPQKSDKSEKTEKSDEIQRRDAQIAHWREKAEKFEKQLKESSKKPETDDSWKAKTEFLLKNIDKKYSDEEFSHISAVASKEGISLDDAAKKSQDYIQWHREKVTKENSIPEPSSPAASSADLEIKPEMSEEEIDRLMIKKAQEIDRKEKSGI